MSNLIEKIRIRRARKADLSGLVFLLEVLFSIEKDFDFDAAKQKQGLKLLLQRPQAAILVAERGGEIIGMCTSQLLISTAEGGLSALVEDVVVLPAWQKQGTGRRLMKAIAAWAAEQGASRVQLLADRNNSKALGFYSRIGFWTTELICLRVARKVEGDG